MIQEVKILIEKMREEDLEEVVTIERESFGDPWTYNMFRAELSNPFSYQWVARDATGRVAGYVCFWVIQDEAHLLNLAVDPSCRRRGIGSRLIADVLEYWKRAGVKSAYLEVRESNVVARRLYERFGFRVLSRRVHYYRNPREDAYVMGIDIR